MLIFRLRLFTCENAHTVYIERKLDPECGRRKASAFLFNIEYSSSSRYTDISELLPVLINLQKKIIYHLISVVKNVFPSIM